MITNSQIERWLEADLGHHDVTNQVPGSATGRLVAKSSGIAAGIEAATAVFEHFDLDVDVRVDAGTALVAGDTLLSVSGPAQDVLRGERVAVNIAGHASGIATRTSTAVERAQAVDPSVRVAGTRKTTPGLRGVEKRAIAAGGGDTHRLDSSHMVMVKDNHIAAMGLDTAIEHFREQASFATKIEVEAETIDQAKQAALQGADIVLLDNMPPAETTEAVNSVGQADIRDVLLEASGGIDLDTVAEYAETGVDVISMGSLTHSASSLDLSFRID